MEIGKIAWEKTAKKYRFVRITPRHGLISSTSREERQSTSPYDIHRNIVHAGFPDKRVNGKSDGEHRNVSDYNGETAT